MEPRPHDDDGEPLRALATSDDGVLETLTRLDDGHETGALEADETDRLVPVDHHTLARVKLLAASTDRSTVGVIDDLLRHAVENHESALAD